MSDVRDLEIGALKFGQLAKMASAVGTALFRVQHAIIHGSLHATMRPGWYDKLSRAQQLLQEVESEIADARKSYEERPGA
ncbi:MAG: hypothetical protein ACK4TP_10190 [Hyphomicrobium sp.]